jgi:hypothetical protein
MSNPLSVAISNTQDGNGGKKRKQTPDSWSSDLPNFLARGYSVVLDWQCWFSHRSSIFKSIQNTCRGYNARMVCVHIPANSHTIPLSLERLKRTADKDIKEFNGRGQGQERGVEDSDFDAIVKVRMFQPSNTLRSLDEIVQQVNSELDEMLVSLMSDHTQRIKLVGNLNKSISQVRGNSCPSFCCCCCCVVVVVGNSVL